MPSTSQLPRRLQAIFSLKSSVTLKTSAIVLRKSPNGTKAFVLFLLFLTVQADLIMRMLMACVPISWQCWKHRGICLWNNGPGQIIVLTPHFCVHGECRATFSSVFPHQSLITLKEEKASNQRRRRREATRLIHHCLCFTLTLLSILLATPYTEPILCWPARESHY